MAAKKAPPETPRPILIARMSGNISGIDIKIAGIQAQLQDVTGRCTEALETDDKLKALTAREREVLTRLKTLCETRFDDLVTVRPELTKINTRSPEWRKE